MLHELCYQWFCTSCTTGLMVRQPSWCCVQRCGHFDRIAYPGFNWVCCIFGEGVKGAVSLRIQQLDVACETKCATPLLRMLHVQCTGALRRGLHLPQFCWIMV